MTETAFKATVGTARSTRQALLTLVREACDILLLAHPSVVASITVSRTLGDGDGAALVRMMAVRLAEEYGVDADARTDGSTVIVRVARDAGHIHVERNNGRHNGARHDGSRGA